MEQRPQRQRNGNGIGSGNGNGTKQFEPFDFGGFGNEASSPNLLPPQQMSQPMYQQLTWQQQQLLVEGGTSQQQTNRYPYPQGLPSHSNHPQAQQTQQAQKKYPITYRSENFRQRTQEQQQQQQQQQQHQQQGQSDTTLTSAPNNVPSQSSTKVLNSDKNFNHNRRNQTFKVVWSTTSPYSAMAGPSSIVGLQPPSDNRNSQPSKSKSSSSPTELHGGNDVLYHSNHAVVANEEEEGEEEIAGEADEEAADYGYNNDGEPSGHKGTNKTSKTSKTKKTEKQVEQLSIASQVVSHRATETPTVTQAVVPQQEMVPPEGLIENAEHMPKDVADAFEDIEARFLLPLSPEEMTDIPRLFFHIEQSHWYYEDHLADKYKHLGHFRKFEKFAEEMYKRCELLKERLPSFQNDLSIFQKYRHHIPVMGAILLTPDLEYCLLVTSFSNKVWSFPKGKINEGEDELECAIREVEEEVGFEFEDAQHIANRSDCFSLKTDTGKAMKLFVMPGVPQDYPFRPKVVKEIGKICWWRVKDLPAGDKMSSTVEVNGKANKFWCVSPFVNELRKWIAKRRKRMKKQQQQIKTGLSLPPAPSKTILTNKDNKQPQKQKQKQKQQEEGNKSGSKGKQNKNKRSEDGVAKSQHSNLKTDGEKSGETPATLNNANQKHRNQREDDEEDDYGEFRFNADEILVAVRQKLYDTNTDTSSGKAAAAPQRKQ